MNSNVITVYLLYRNCSKGPSKIVLFHDEVEQKVMRTDEPDWKKKIDYLLETTKDKEKYYPTVYFQEVEIKNKPKKINFFLETHRAILGFYKYYSDRPITLHKHPNQVRFLFGTVFNSNPTYNTYNDPPPSPVGNPIHELVSYFLTIIHKTNFEELQMTLLEDFSKHYPLQTKLTYSSALLFDTSVLLDVYSLDAHKVFLLLDIFIPSEGVKLYETQVSRIQKQLNALLDLRRSKKLFENQLTEKLFAKCISKYLIQLAISEFSPVIADVNQSFWEAYSKNFVECIVELGEIPPASLITQKTSFLRDTIYQAIKIWDKADIMNLLPNFLRVLMNATFDSETLFSMLLPFSDIVFKFFEDPSSKLTNDFIQNLMRVSQGNSKLTLLLLNDNKSLFSEAQYQCLVAKLLKSVKSLNELREMISLVCGDDVQDQKTATSLITLVAETANTIAGECSLIELLKHISKGSPLCGLVCPENLESALKKNLPKEAKEFRSDLMDQLWIFLKDSPQYFNICSCLLLKNIKKREDLLIFKKHLKPIFTLVSDESCRDNASKFLSELARTLVDVCRKKEEAIAECDELLQLQFPLSFSHKIFCGFFWDEFQFKFGDQIFFQSIKSVNSGQLKDFFKEIILQKNTPKVMNDTDLQKFLKESFSDYPNLGNLDEYSDKILAAVINKTLLNQSILKILPEINENHVWAVLLSLKGNVSQSWKCKQIQFIKDEVTELIEKLEKNTIVVEEAELIEKIDLEQLKVVSELMLKKISINNYLPHLTRIKFDTKELLTKIRDFANFFQDILFQAQDSENIQTEFKSFQESLPKTQLSKVIFPENIESYRNFVQEYNHTRDSKIFSSHLWTCLNSLEKKDIESVLAGFQKVLSQLRDLKNILEDKEGTETLDCIESLFRDFNNPKIIDAELKLLSRYLHLSQETTQDISKSLHLLQNRADFIDKTSVLLKFVELYSPEGLNSTWLTEIRELSEKISESKQSIAALKNCFDKMKTIEIYNNQGLFDLLRACNKSFKLCQFTIEKTQEEINNMIELLDEYGTTFITTNEVGYLFQLLPFYTSLNHNRGPHIEAFLAFLQGAIRNVRFQNISEKIEILAAKLGYLEQLTNKGEATRGIIRTIMDGGTALVFLKKSTFFVEIKSRGSRTAKPLEIKDAIELRDRIQLKLKTSETQLTTSAFHSDEREQVVYEAYIKCVDHLEKIVQSLQQLYQKGSQSILNIYTFKFEEHVLKNQQVRFEQLENEWDATLAMAYEKYYSLTHYYGQQFDKAARELEQFSKNRYFTFKDAKILNILPQFENKELKLEPFQLDQVEDSSKYLVPLGEYLERTLPSCVKEIEVSQLPGARTFIPVKTETALETICTLHTRRTGELPKLQNCLLCTFETTEEEILAFLYRYAFCPYRKKLFSICQPEALKPSTQEGLIKTLFQMLDHFESQKKCIIADLAILTSQMTGSLTNELLTYNFRQENMGYDDEETLTAKFSNLPYNVCVVTSRETGYGKSLWIRSQARRNRLVYFPIIGTETHATIVKKLVSKEIVSGNILHLDVGNLSLENWKIINHLLFHILILGGVSTYEDLFVTPRKCQIYIEIQNSLDNRIASILRYFNRQVFDQLPKFRLLEEMRPIHALVFSILLIYHQKQLEPVELSEVTNYYNPETAESLLHEYFLKDIKSPNFYIIHSFLKIAYSLFFPFTQSVFFSNKHLEKKAVKYAVANAILEYAKNYTVKSIEAAKEMQNTSLLQGMLENKSLGDEYNALDQGIISFASEDFFSLIFTSDGCCLPIYSKSEKIPGSFKELLNVQKIQIENFQKLDPMSLLAKLCDFTGLFKSEDKERVANAAQSYVITPDNFFKMCLVITKLRAGLPVIMMGEAGCGKTSLVKFLAENVMRVNFHKINFHAGVTASSLEEELKGPIEKAKENPQKEFWLFLDEVNTSETLGITCEMMLKGSFSSTPLPPNFRYIAAVNPYVRRACRVEVGLVKKKALQKVRELAYIVYPLPQSLFNFVWNFGQLLKQDEISYINHMIADIKDQAIKITAIHCIAGCHDFIRYHEGPGSVSLRDVRRFVVVFNWFLTNLKRKNEISLKQKSFISSKNPQKIQLKSVILSLIICYYIRMESQAQRIKLLEHISKSLEKDHRIRTLLGYKYTINDKILHIIEKEQTEYLQRIMSGAGDMLKGIAFNTALRENVFTMLVGLMTRIPIIICGKPGCSKTLAFQLIVSSLKGQDSNDEFFKTLPRLIPITYQGSMQSSSAGIIRVFDKAKKFLEERYNTKNAMNSKEREEIISAVFFDEMGLAELSRNNPLKVLHSLLEYDVDVDSNSLKTKVAFVGISNWRLDTSKMNRAIFVARPDLTLRDLQLTGQDIFKSFDLNFTGHDQTIRVLVETYNEFRQQQRQEFEKENFHGLRDFYSLIKTVCRYISKFSSEKADNPREDAVNLAIERNFGGLKDSSKLFKEILKKKDPSIDFKDIPVLELTNSNFTDPDSRYLMLITRGNFGPQILSNYLQKFSNGNFEVIVGSRFERDIDQEEYSSRILSRIINCMEEGRSIIMQGLDHIYPSLYDLFNQNFAFISKKKTCKVALGTTNNSSCTIHDDFRCIILVDERFLQDQDPPFLNRFEKQLVNWENVLSEPKMALVINELKDWMNKFCNLNLQNDAKSIIHPSWLVINFTNENLAAIVSQNWDPEVDAEKILERCKYELVLTATEDLIPHANVSKGSKYQEELYNIYYSQPHGSLDNFVLSLSEKKAEITKSIVFTYSNGFEPLRLTDTIKEYSLASVNSEKQLDEYIQNFVTDDKADRLFIRIDAEEHQSHIDLVRFLVDRATIQQQKKRKKGVIQKHIIIMIHLNRQRILDGRENGLFVSYLAGWNQIVIDTLNPKTRFDFRKIMTLTSEEILRDERIIRYQELLPAMLANTYMRFTFTSELSEDTYSKNHQEYLTDIIHVFATNEKLSNLLFERILRSLSTINKKWFVEIITDQSLLAMSKSMNDAIVKFFQRILEHPLCQIIYSLEEQGGLGSLLYLNSAKKEKELLYLIWIDIFEKMPSKEDVRMNYGQNILRKSWNTRFPFSFQDVSLLFEKIKEEHLAEYKNLQPSILEDPDDTGSQHTLQKLLEKMDVLIEDCRSIKIIMNFGNDPEKYALLRRMFCEDVLQYFLKIQLKSGSKYFKMVEKIAEEIIEKDKNFSHLQIWLVAQQRRFSSLLSIATELWQDDNTEIDSAIQYYEHISSSKKNYSNSLNYMLEALMKDVMPSPEMLEKFSSSWENFSRMLEKIVLNVQIIDQGFRISDEWLEFTFWRNITCLYVETNHPDIKNDLFLLGDIKKTLGGSSFLFDPKFRNNCCRFFEKLYDYSMAKNQARLKPTPNNVNLLPAKILHAYSDYLTRCFERAQVQDPAVKEEIFCHALKYQPLTPFAFHLVRRGLENIDFDFNENDYFSDNEYSNIIEKLMITYDGDLISHLDYIISSSLVKPYIQTHLTESAEISADATLELFKGAWKRLNGKSLSKHLDLRKLIALNIIKELISHYALWLFQVNNKQEKLNLGNQASIIIQEQKDFIEFILNDKTQNPISNSLRIYALKMMSERYGSLQASLEYNKEIEWIKKFQGLNEGVKRIDYSGTDSMHSALYEELLQKIQLFWQVGFDPDTAAIEIMNVVGENSDASQPLLAVIYDEIFWRYLDKELPRAGFISLAKQLNPKLLEIIGAGCTRFLVGLLTNFEDKSMDGLLSLTPGPGSPDNIRLLSLVIHCAISMLPTISKNKGIYGFLMQEGAFITTAQRISKVFLPGAEELDSQNIDILRFMIASNTITGGTKLYRCSCGEPYFIGDCGRAMEQKPCANCKQPIGGANHVLVARQGHQEIQKVTPEVAMQELTKYYSSLPPGYFPKLSGDIQNPNHSVRDLRPTTYRLISFIQHSLLYSILASGAVSENQMAQILQLSQKNLTITPRQYLIGHLKSTWNYLRENLNLIGDTYVFLHAFIDAFATFSSEYSPFQTAIERNQWEKKFENEVVGFLLADVTDVVRQYKLASQKAKKTQGYTLQALMNEAVDLSKIPESIYPYMPSLRIMEDGCLESFEIAFRRQNLQDDFPFTALYLENSSEIELLSSLGPIISFTNQAMRRYAMQLSQNEAIERKIGDYLSEFKEERPNFQNFREAWQKIHKHATWYECKQLDALPDITEYHELIYILPNNSSNGGGLYVCAAFQKLAEIQNHCINSILENPRIQKKYPYLQHIELPTTIVQDATEENIIMGAELRARINEIIILTSYPDPEFGKGRNVIYNWKIVEDVIARHFTISKRRLDAQNLRMMQFKGELYKGKDSDAIKKLREKIPQKLMKHNELAYFEEALKRQIRNKEYIEKLHTSLEIILSDVLNQVSYTGETTIEKVCKSIPKFVNLPINLGSESLFQNQKLFHLGQIYEAVESLGYSYLQLRIPKKFKVELTVEAKQQMTKMFSAIEAAGFEARELLPGIKRVALRYLEENLNPLEHLKVLLLYREGIWPEDRYDIITDFLESNFPEELLLENCLTIIEDISSYIEQKEKEAAQEKNDQKELNIPKSLQKENKSLVEGRNLLGGKKKGANRGL